MPENPYDAISKPFRCLVCNRCHVALVGKFEGRCPYGGPWLEVPPFELVGFPEISAASLSDEKFPR